MNYFLLASSIENQGLCATIQHLFTMKTKSVKRELLKAAENDPFLFSYIRDM
jgi:hypothetical protein